MNALIRQNKTTTEEMTISRWEKSEPLGSGCGQLCAGRRCTTNDAPTQVVKLRQRRVTWTTGEPVCRYSIDNLSHADMSISACHMQTCQSVHVTCRHVNQCTSHASDVNQCMSHADMSISARHMHHTSLAVFHNCRLWLSSISITLGTC